MLVLPARSAPRSGGWGEFNSYYSRWSSSPPTSRPPRVPFSFSLSFQKRGQLCRPPGDAPTSSNSECRKETGPPSEAGQASAPPQPFITQEPHSTLDGTGWRGAGSSARRAPTASVLAAPLATQNWCFPALPLCPPPPPLHPSHRETSSVLPSPRPPAPNTAAPDPSRFSGVCDIAPL